ncbi:RNA polymerase sigma factor [Kolteria novifilia]|uniref:RNA polymerase sigma factor n=1 Tax=Kolteria novifilia TaxID=2527975 RepID=UPI003AF3898F
MPHNVHMAIQESSFGSTSSDLISRVRARDDDAWRRLVDLYGPLVIYWCRRSRLDSSDAADVVQEVFASVAGAIDQYQAREGGRFRGWLWTITRNKIHDHFRRIEKQGQAVGGTAAHQRIAELPDYQPDESSDAEDQQQLSQFLHRALEVVRVEFEENTWKAFWRAAIDGDSTSDIAADMGISANGVRQAKSRVLRRLRDELGEDPL